MNQVNDVVAQPADDCCRFPYIHPRTHRDERSPDSVQVAAQAAVARNTHNGGPCHALWIEQRGSDWAPRWWRAEDCGLVAPIMVLNGRRIEQRTSLAQEGGSIELPRSASLRDCRNRQRIRIPGCRHESRAQFTARSEPTLRRRRATALQYRCVSNARRDLDLGGAETVGHRTLFARASERAPLPRRCARPRHGRGVRRALRDRRLSTRGGRAGPSAPPRTWHWQQRRLPDRARTSSCAARLS